MRFCVNACLSALPLALLACGGSGGGDVDVPPPDYVGFFDRTSAESSTLKAHALNTTTLAVGSASGSLNRTGDRVTGAGMTGDINATRTQIALDGGGTVTLTDGTTDYVAVFAAEPVGGNPAFGVVGVPTEVGDMPGGSAKATYSGTSNFVIVDNTTLYDLVGSASVTADFNAKDLDARFTALDGTRTDGMGAPESVSNVATITLNNAVISGNTFSGGSAGLSSSQISTDLSGGETVTTSGGFYGPGADEVGGVVKVDDTTSGSLLLLGDFVAD